MRHKETRLYLITFTNCTKYALVADRYEIKLYNEYYVRFFNGKEVVGFYKLNNIDRIVIKPRLIEGIR